MVTILTQSLLYQLIGKWKEKRRKKKANNSDNYQQELFTTKLDSKLKSAKNRSYSQVSVLIVYYRVKIEWSLLASKQSLLPSSSTLPTTNTWNNSSLTSSWPVQTLGGLRGWENQIWSLTWWSPQESHQTSQVMPHWSEKCKPSRLIEAGVDAFLGHFCCQV